MTVEAIERVADPVLHEGYPLMPAPAPAAKNCMRWQCGVLAPQRPSTALGAGPDAAEGEPWFSQTECLLRPAADARLYIRMRGETIEDGRGVPRSANLIPVDLAMEAIRHVRLGVPGLDARLTIEVTPGEPVKLRLRLENHDPWRTEFADDRDALLRHSLVSAHILLDIDNGHFIYPETAAEARPA